MLFRFELLELIKHACIQMCVYKADINCTCCCAHQTVLRFEFGGYSQVINTFTLQSCYCLRIHVVSSVSPVAVSLQHVGHWLFDMLQHQKIILPCDRGDRYQAYGSRGAICCPNSTVETPLKLVSKCSSCSSCF